MFVLGNLFQGVATILDKVCWLYSIVIMVSVLISWVSPDPLNPLVRILRSTTDPLFAWVRQRLPFAMVGMFDLSPIIVLLGIQLLQMVVIRSLFDLAIRLR